tara:strand:+ start:1092 stop:1610 length:519 start_codon:yes stop_codon:yes gene_type:complete
MLTIPANDHGAIYVLELNRPAPDGLTEKTDAAMMAVFGRAVVNTDYIDAIAPGTLTDMSLADLIRNGYEMPVSEREAETLRGLVGTVVLLMSAAFGGAEIKIDLPANVRLVTILREGAQMAVPQPIYTDSAKGVVPPKSRKLPSDAAMSGRVATIALLVLFFLVAVMIWIAG